MFFGNALFANGEHYGTFEKIMFEIEKYRRKIVVLCRKYRVIELSIFGSAVVGESRTLLNKSNNYENDDTFKNGKLKTDPQNSEQDGGRAFTPESDVDVLIVFE